MKTPRKYMVLSLVSIGLLVNGCSGLTQSDKPAVTSWWLKPYTGSAMIGSTETDPGNVASLELSVEAVPGLDTPMILALSADSALKPYLAARWVDYLPELLDSLLRRSIQASGKYKVVSGRAGASPEHCDLQLEIREFFTRLDAGGNTLAAYVTMQGSYQCGSGTSQAFLLTASKPVEDERMKNIVEAFQTALDEVLQELLKQLS